MWAFRFFLSLMLMFDKWTGFWWRDSFSPSLGCATGWRAFKSPAQLHFKAYRVFKHFSELCTGRTATISTSTAARDKDSGRKVATRVHKCLCQQANCQGCLLAATADGFLPEYLFFLLSFSSFVRCCWKRDAVTCLARFVSLIGSWSPRIHKHLMLQRKILEKREKSHLSRRHIPQFHLVSETGCIASHRRRRHKNLFLRLQIFLLFCIFCSVAPLAMWLFEI